MNPNTIGQIRHEVQAVTRYIDPAKRDDANAHVETIHTLLDTLLSP